MMEPHCSTTCHWGTVGRRGRKRSEEGRRKGGRREGGKGVRRERSERSEE